MRSITDSGIKSCITLLSGGFPCQPFSTAGKQRGSIDDRHLWPEMLRIVTELQPTWILGENVTGIIGMELDNCLSSLEDIGYSCRAFNIPACSVGAIHRRSRVFIVSHIANNGRSRIPKRSKNRKETIDNPGNNCVDTHTRIGSKGGTQNEGDRWEKMHLKNNRGEMVSLLGRVDLPFWEGRDQNPVEVATRLCRVDDGVSHRVHRLTALGNAVVPQQVYPILKAIADIEGSSVI